jgi:predicted nucleic acid-binding protein
VASLIHLDTNYLIFGADRTHAAHRQLKAWRASGETFAVSAMAWSEFRCGPLTPALLQAWEALVEGRVVPIDRTVAERASDIFNLTGRRARSLPDCLIAAAAMRSGASLATLNPKDFSAMAKLGLVLA